MIFSYNWLQSFFKKQLPKPEKLAELLTMHAFEVKDLKEIKNQKSKIKNDWVLDIDILSNRGPDCFSHIGIAREIAAIAELRIKNPAEGEARQGRQELRIREDKKIKAKDFITVEVKNKKDCQRYTARVIVDVKVGSSPKWIQERLKVCGLRPINNIVDIANYVMLETGQPLHAFDYNKLTKKIIVRRAKKGEKITTLEGEKYDLDEDILIIADSKSPLAIAGIKGGKKAEIDKKTKTVVLESANFNPRVVRKGSQKIGLKTDASWRFEHEIDPNLTGIAINQAAYLIQKICGGKITSGLVDFYPNKILAKKIKLDLKYVEKLLGTKIPEKKIKEILKRLSFKVTHQRINSSTHQLLVEVPTFRLDISLPEDLIEEIGRIYGYQKVPATFPVVSLIPPEKNLEIFWEDFAKNILKEAGFSEVYNYSFVGEEIKPLGYKEEDVIEIENPVSVEQKYLRPSLIPNLLKNVKNNFPHFNEIKIFELGKIFRKIKNQKSKIKNTNQKLNIIEKRMISGLIASKETIQKADEFYQLKGVIDSLLNKLGVSDVWYDSYRQTPEESKLAIWHLEKSAEIKIGQEEIGFLGEISQKILEVIKIKGKIVLFDIDFEKLTRLCSEEHEYQPVSQYPAAVRDLALLVPQGVRVEEVLNKIEAVGGSLIRDIDLFDIYEGEEITVGKKNLAFHIIYQAEDRTLKSEEIDKIQEKIIKILEENPGWEVRK